MTFRCGRREFVFRGLGLLPLSTLVNSTTYRAQAVWTPPGNGTIWQIVWLDEQSLICYVGQPNNAEGLYLYPPGKPLLTWERRDNSDIDAMVSVGPTLGYCDRWLHFNQNDRVLRAEVRRQGREVALGARQSVLNFREVLRGLSMRGGFLQWVPIGERVAYTLYDRFGFHRVVGLRCVGHAMISAFSETGEVAVVRERYAPPEVWHIDPRRDQVLWKRRARDRSPSDAGAIDNISWDPIRSTATLVYSADYSGKLTKVEIVQRSQDKVIYDSEHTRGNLIFASEAKSWRDSITFAGEAPDGVNHIGVFNKASGITVFPDWGANGRALSVSPDGNRIAFTRRDPAHRRDELILVRAH